MEQVAGIFRAFLASLFGGLVAKGYLSADQAGEIVNMLLGIGGVIAVAVWSFASNKLTSMVQHVAEQPDVKIIITKADLANSVESSKVVPADPIRSIQ